MLAELLVGEIEWGQVLHALRPIAVHYVGRHAPVLEVGSSVRLQVMQSASLSPTLLLLLHVSFPVRARFSEAAELVNVCWLEIRGKIQSRMLSGRRTYAAYLIFRLADWSRGLGHPPQEASVTVGVQHSSTHVVRLQPNDSPSRVRARRNRIRFGPLVRWGAMMLEIAADQEASAAAAEVGDARDDGWMEAELGEFYNEEGEDGEVEMSLMEVKGGHWKKGLIIQGIEIRPKA